MPNFTVRYTYKNPTPKFPQAIVVGAKPLEADDEDDARFKFTGLKELKNAKGLIITSVEEY